MVSLYQYCTVAELEAYAGVDYSLYSGYTDTVIEANISQAERLVNGYMGISFTGTIPDIIKYTALELARRTMFNLMIHDSIAGYSEKKPFLPLFDEYLKEGLNIIKTQKMGYAKSIPMRKEIDYGRLQRYLY